MKRLLIVIFAMYASCAFAQDRVFEGSLLLGGSATQIAGDYLAGYNKLGLMGGGRMAIRVSDRRRVVLEMLYSQRGSRSRRIESLNPVSISTQYIEVPLLYQWNDWLREDKKGKYYSANFYGGLSYGRLMSATATLEHRQPIAEVVDEFNLHDVSAIVGFSFLTSRHFGFSGRYTRGLLPLYNSSKNNLAVNDPKVRMLYGYHISLILNYYF